MITIDITKAEFIGEGPMVKGAAYQVYKQDGKYYALIVSGQARWVVDGTTIEIQENEIDNYIDRD